MTLIPESLKQEWQSYVDDLNTDLGTECRLFYEDIIAQDANLDDPGAGRLPMVSLPFGGRGQGFLTPGNPEMNGPNAGETAVTVTQVTKDIVCRVYPMLKDFDRYGIDVQDSSNIYEVVTHAKNMPDIMRANYIILYVSDLPERRIKAKLIKAPTPYGLGSPYNCRSFWQEV